MAPSVLAAALLAAGCSGGASTPPGPSVANGGSIGVGGSGIANGTGGSAPATSSGGNANNSNGGNGNGKGGAANAGGAAATGNAPAAGGNNPMGGANANGGAQPQAGGASSIGGASSTGGVTSVPTTCTTDSQCPNGHCVSGSCVCWDTNQKMCGSSCIDVKYNNNACGDCNKACPASAPRCDNGTCKCDSPPCGNGTGAGGATGQGGNAATGGNRATGGNQASGGSQATGGSQAATGGNTGSTTQPPPITNGSDGWASRYWDCCKPSCGWSANAGGKPMQSCSQSNSRLSGYDTQSACAGGSAFMCWDFVPWSVSDTLAYGFAAHNGVACGSCYQIEFSGTSYNGNSASCAPLKGKTMIVQVINTGGIANNQFDLLIPGGGVGDFNACSTQWGSSDLGATFGGFLAGCAGSKSCVQTKCSTIFGSKPVLKAGCDWFTGWFNAADNPSMKFQKVTCPAAITAKSGMSG